MLDCSRRASLALAVSLLLAAIGCGPAASPGVSRPTPRPQGSPIGSPASMQIDAAGGTITSPDGVLAVSIPAGALSAPTQFSIQTITNTAPAGAGNSYLLGPEGATFPSPVTLTFRAGSTGRSVDGLTVAYQEGSGYWLRVPGVQRDAVAGTLTATTNHFSGWGLVTTPTPQDLAGSFTYGSTLADSGIPFTATGSATLNFVGSDSFESAYLSGGTITMVPGVAGCTPAAATVPLDTNVAEVVNSPLQFLWGIAARWGVTCTSPGSSLVAFTAFDTAGIALFRCARGYVGTPVIGPNRVAGTYAIDCGADGRTTATWDFTTAICGQPCASSNPCHTAAWACATGTAVCTDTGNVTPGTSCGTNLVCSPAGTCISCTAGVACSTNPNQCVQGTTSCATGAQTCVDTTTNVPSIGTSCAIAGNCFQDAVTCVANVPTCAPTATPLPAGTSCGTNFVCNGAGACNACTAGLACSTNPNRCVLGTTSCATGAQTCVDTTTNVPSIGTSCAIAGNCFQDTVTCVANTPTCTATTTPLGPGTSCGTNLVCNGAGACNPCTAGVACSTNPNQCVLGATSCATGAPTCIDTTTNVPSIGTSCAIAGNCFQDAVTCVANTPTCTPTATPLGPGTSCGSNFVCNGAGACNACTAGAGCSTNPNPCVQGTTSCATGAPTCVDTTTSIAAGTSCGTNLVCNGTGTCTPCTAGLACSTNPNQCVLGTTSCATGAPTCIDTTTNVPSIGVACVIAGDCFQDAVTCVASIPTCTATTTPLPAGTSCGTNRVCSSTQTCIDCTQGASCTPANPCHVGTTECSSGAPLCTDTAANQPNGTPCGTGSTCNAGSCVPSRTVTGTRLVSYWPDAGAPLAGVPAPDVNGPPFATVSALVPGAAGSWDTYAGTFTASGSFSIPNVPAGTYILSFTDGNGVHTLVETASSTVDLGYDVLGRSDATRPAASTPVTLDVSGLTAWDPSGDQVQITSSNADAWDVPIRGAQLAPLATATPVPGIVDDWFASASGGALNLLAAPDVLYVHDLATTSATRAVALTTHPYQYAASWTSVTGTALTSGTPATINTALTAAPQTGYVAGSAAQALDWSLSLFEAQLPGLIGTAIAPAGSTHTLAVGASAHPLTNPAPVAVGSPILFQMSLPAGTGDFATTASLAYGQFLDATLWNEWRRIDFSAPVSYSAPLSTVALIDEAMLGRAEPMSPTVPTPIVPTLGPVQSPLVNGTLGAFASLAGVTTTPTLSWSAPALGVPTSYTVEILALGLSGGTTTTVATRVARWRTASTTVVVPPNLLLAGTTYYARITANANAPDPFDSQPNRAANVFTYASTLTGTFSP